MRKNNIFFTLFNEEMNKVLAAAEAFVDLVRNYENVNDKIANMKILETECDMQAHKIFKTLNKSRITIFDREDIFAITRGIDDIVDSLEEVSNRFGVFPVTEIRPDTLKMAEIGLLAVKSLRTVFLHLPEIRKPKTLMDQIIEVNRIENEGDIIYRKALENLFRDEKDPIEVIKWKHIYEQIEASIDSCENVANLVEGVIMKHV